jgi:hypothetical protein
MRSSQHRSLAEDEAHLLTIYSFLRGTLLLVQKFFSFRAGSLLGSRLSAYLLIGWHPNDTEKNRSLVNKFRFKSWVPDHFPQVTV